MGPFVDVEHPQISSGLCERTFARVFQEEVAGRLEAWGSQHRSTKIVIMPSVRDAHHCAVFPQPAFSGKQLNAAQVGSQGEGCVIGFVLLTKDWYCRGLGVCVRCFGV